MNRQNQKAACSAFGRCGNCEELNVPYPRQLEMKQALVEKLLGEFGPVLPIIGMKNPAHYRCKVHRVVGQNRQGRIVLGSYAQGSHFLVPVENCLLEDVSCQKILQTLGKLFTSFHLQSWNENTGRGHIRHILLRKGAATGEIMVVLVCPDFTFPGKNHFVQALRAAHPEITTLVLNRNREETDMILGDRETVLYGPGFIRDSLCGLTFRISAQSFFQVNPVQAEKLYRVALDFASLTGRETLVDAYCGTGTIGLSAASRAREVLGFELSPSAVRDARRNAQDNGISNARFFCCDAGEELTRMAEEGLKADVILLDPPRSGSTEAFLRSAAWIGPERIVYISCGPESLARDLGRLNKLGYQAEIIQPVDLFPYTARHVETVVKLKKR